MELERAPFDVAAMIHAAADTVRPSAQANGNIVEVHVSEDVGEAVGDGFRLSQCVLNLLSNAAKFTKNGVVTLSARREAFAGQDWLVFDVADTGIGISREAQSKIFKPFTQADASTTRAFGGTGLGLTITKRIIDLMGGTIELESEPGKGSRFSLRAPARTLSTAAPAAPAPPAPRPHAKQGPLALIIDPDALDSDLAVRALSRLGFQCERRSSPEEALTAAQTLGPALIVLDLCLEGGEALLRRLAEGAAAPVVVVSASDDRQRALSLGACASLVKPVSRERLCAAALQFARRHDGELVTNPTAQNRPPTAVGV
jgi:CheY-like chemotaxis protein/two-component sensor histidine kinase